MKRIFILTAIIGLLVFTIWFKKFGPSATADLPETIIVGTSADFPPFSFRNNEKEIVGFDIDVANAIAKNLGKKLVIQDLKFELLFPELEAGNIHAIVGVSETTSRDKKALFSKAYLAGDTFVILTLPKNRVASLFDVEDKRIAVNTGYPEELYFSEYNKYYAVETVKTKSLKESLDLLDKEKVYAVVTSLKNLKTLFKNKEEEKYNKFIIKETDENFAFAISKKYKELLPKVQAAFKELEENGTLQTLREKWKVI